MKKSFLNNFLHLKFYISTFNFKNKNLKSGFSLIEILILLFLLSVGFVFYFSSSQTTVLIRLSDHKMTAHQIAFKKIESIKSLAPSNWPPNGNFNDSSLNLLPQGEANLNISNFDQQGKLKKIKVDVLWNESGTQKIYTLETLIFVP
jgi:type II secretory pathway pseudopilin PulG